MLYALKKSDEKVMTPYSSQYLLVEPTRISSDGQDPD